MGRKVIDRTGERNINNFDSEMVIVEYRSAKDIDVYFSEYDWTAKRVRYDNFKRGNVKCPYEKRYCDVGYLGEGKYKVWENGRDTKCYITWNSMLKRCYDEKNRSKRNLTYMDCEVSEEFHNFQNFAKWYYENYYEIEGQRMDLDKDILIKGNKVYSPETCIFVPETINLLFIKRQNDRGESVIGTSPKNGKYQVKCSLINPKTRKSKQEYLGLFDTQEKGFEVYKYYKEKNIKMVADYFKSQIPTILYDALYNYEVEITD